MPGRGVPGNIKREGVPFFTVENSFIFGEETGLKGECMKDVS